MARKIYFITSNDHKLEEAKKILAVKGVTIIPKQIEIPELQSMNQKEVSQYKADRSFEIIKKPLIVDDAGLFIQRYSGFPGVYTNFISNTIGVAGLYKLIFDNEPAVFMATVTYTDGSRRFSAQGKVSGVLKKVPIKQNMVFSDFFFVNDSNESLTGQAQKEQPTHRTIALLKLAQWLGDKSK